MSSLFVDGKEILEQYSFKLSMPYTSGSGMKSFTITDPTSSYFVNGVCKHAGVYTFVAHIGGGSGTASPSMTRASVTAGGTEYITTGLGWPGVANPAATCTVTVKLNVNDTVSAYIHGNGATFTNTYLLVTKIS